VSVDMDKVGVMATYCNPLCVCVCVSSSLSKKGLFLDSELHTHKHIGLHYAATTPTTFISTDTI